MRVAEFFESVLQDAWYAARGLARRPAFAAVAVLTLGLAPERGRDFEPSLDAHIGAPHEAIISYVLWQRRFDADPSIIGRAIVIDREPWTIVGVGPRAVRGLSGQADVFLPVTTVAAELRRPGTSMLSLVARRAPGGTVLRATEEMSTLGARWRSLCTAQQSLTRGPPGRSCHLLAHRSPPTVGCAQVAETTAERGSRRCLAHTMRWPDQRNS